jgi:hypothetical protein
VLMEPKIPIANHHPRPWGRPAHGFQSFNSSSR